MTIKKGKFIVIDGTDGSGKGTQTRMLIDMLKNAGYSVRMADFPQYGRKSAGPIEDYLNGSYGDAKEVGPYRASVLYAVDRYDAREKIRKWLDEGKIVISNRYVSANMGHQGGKIEDPGERRKFLDWLYNLEYGIFGIPKPDLNIILHVEPEIAQKLVDKKSAAEREYAGGAKRDIHEADLDHLKAAESVYMEIARSYGDFNLIRCTEDGEIMTRESINYRLWERVMDTVHSKENGRLRITYKHYENILTHLPKNENVEEEIHYKEDEGGVLKVQKIHDRAKPPTRAYQHDAGLDLYAHDFYSVLPGEQAKIATGIKMAIPDGHAGLIWSKSSVAGAGVHVVAGVVDAGFRGEVSVLLINLGQDIYHIAPGQKVAQMIIQKVEYPELREDSVEDKTERGDGEYGSSGKF